MKNGLKTLTKVTINPQKMKNNHTAVKYAKIVSEVLNDFLDSQKDFFVNVTLYYSKNCRLVLLKIHHQETSTQGIQVRKEPVLKVLKKIKPFRLAKNIRSAFFLSPENFLDVFMVVPNNRFSLSSKMAELKAREYILCQLNEVFDKK